jgi:hypothetical protein
LSEHDAREGALIMFAFSATKQRLRAAVASMFHAGAGVAFMLMAMFAIQYEEFVAPELARVGDAWGSAATEAGKRLMSFSL